MATAPHGPAAERLFALEAQFWTSGAEFYRANLTPGFLMLFPNLGILDRASTVEGLARGRRWSAVEMTERRLTPLDDRTVIMSYKAAARREGDETPYAALVSSVYVERDGTWKLAFHHQSPVEPR